MYILCCKRIKKDEPRFAMFFQATDGRLKIFALEEEFQVS